MPSRSTEFPLTQKATPLGLIPDCKIPISILTQFGYESFIFVLDTGADCSMAPLSLAEDIGIDLSQCPSYLSMGIEGKGLKTFLGKISIKIGDEALEIRCLFADRETTPYILGRMDLFSHFSIMFDNQHNKIRFTRLS